LSSSALISIGGITFCYNDKLQVEHFVAFALAFLIYLSSNHPPNSARENIITGAVVGGGKRSATPLFLL
jgi:CBS-domain-containing membrane protein